MNKNYNYIESIKNKIVDYIKKNIDLSKYDFDETIRHYLLDQCIYAAIQEVRKEASYND